jgi:hypothetical protein
MKHINVIIGAFAFLLGTFIIANAYKYKLKQNETIVVTGLAEKDFLSDQIVWSGSYVRRGADLKEAYALLKADENNLKKYLQEKGIKVDEMVFSAISIEKEYANRYNTEGNIIGNSFVGYILTQTVTINSGELEKVEKTSREITELIEQGIEFNSSAPSYFYSKLSELKIDLLAKATADAKLRAETIAENSGGKINEVKSANMGIFQITGKNSNDDYSYGGAFNTSSKAKTASITIKIEYTVN